MENDTKQRIFSGVQPSGNLTIGNYLGALKNWTKLQDDYECIYCVVDQHAITVRQSPTDLRRRTYEVMAIYIACGLDPVKNIMFVQSHVPAHAQLSWVLNCYTMFGELSRMTQFKDKSAKNADNINAGLFTYPTLMAADILLYQAHLVPVGEDQRQHIEITRDIAERFNSVHGDTFRVPEAYITKGAKIYSLAEPANKMSKSDPNPCAFISLFDTKDDIIRKFKRAVTDSDACVRRAEDKPGVSNLMTVYNCFTGNTDEQTEREFAGRGYGDFKTAVAEACARELMPIQAEFARIMKDRATLDRLLKTNAERAAHIAEKTLSRVYRRVGFVQL